MRVRPGGSHHQKLVVIRHRAILETLQAFKRAGCAGVITYFAPRAARLLGA